MMAFLMPKSPAYINYSTTLVYTLVFFLIASAEDRKAGGPLGPEVRCWRQQQHILWLTACTTLSNFTFQFSDPWVAGVTAELLLYMSIPAVWLSSIYVLHDSFTLRESAGVVIVLVAILIGILPRMLQERHEVGDESNPAWAVVLYGLSAGLQGLVMMFQERATRAPNDLRPATALFWYNLYCCVTALFTIPMEAVPYLNGTVTGRSLSDAFQNQVHSLCCAAGAPYAEDVLTGYCKVGAWLWPQVYALSHAGMFYLNARLIQRFNALWVGVINTLCGPLSAMAFAFPALVGAENVKSVNWLATGVSFVLILGGVVLKGLPSSDPRAVVSTTAADASLLEDRGAGIL